MKQLSDLRRNKTQPIVESLDSGEQVKVNQLARLGLVSKEDVTRLKRALSKDTTNLTRGEKDLLVSVFDSLLDKVLHNQQLFQKTKQSFKEEDVAEDAKPNLDVHGENHNFAFPVLLLLRRKAIRLFPDGKKVALYYADKLNRYFSVPSSGDAVAEELSDEDVIELVEATAPAAKKKPKVHKAGAGPGNAHPNKVPAGQSGENSSDVISRLKGIVANKERAHVKFKDGSKLTVDMLTAHALLTAYERLSKPENKVHFDKLLNKSNPHFMKAVDFAHKHYLSGGQTGQQ